MTSLLSLWVTDNCHVRGLCKLRGQKKGKKVDQKFLPQKITQLISNHLIQKTGYEAATGIVRLLSKASDTGSSRHIKTGCHLPVCITRADRKQATNWNGRLVGVG